MSDDEMRVKIAEACGWVWGRPYNPKRALFSAPIGYHSPAWTGGDESNSIYWPYNGRTMDELRLDLISALPDYLNSLDAMHKAEKHYWGDPVFRQLFRGRLVALVNNRSAEAFEPTQDEWAAAIHATARQRATAFLATVCP